MTTLKVYSSTNGADSIEIKPSDDPIGHVELVVDLEESEDVVWLFSIDPEDVPKIIEQLKALTNRTL